MNIVLSGFVDREFTALKILLQRRLNAVVFREACTEPVRLVLLNATRRVDVAHYRRLQALFPDTPMLALGSAPDLEGLETLPQPFNLKALLERVRQMLRNGSRSVSVQGKLVAASSVQAADKRFDHYDVNSCLAGLLRQALNLQEQKNRDVLLEGPFFLLIQTDGTVISSISRSTLYRLASNRSRDLQFGIRVLEETEKQAWLQGLSSEVRMTRLDREALVWAMAVASSHGELPEQLADTLPLHLTSWPDCTHIENAHLVLPVVAQLARRPCSSSELVHNTGFTTGQVASVVTALFVAGNIQLQESTRPVVWSAGKTPTGISGMLSQLARRMAGKIFGGQPQHKVA